MKMTAKEWIDNLREANANLGLNSKAKKEFSNKDPLDSMSKVTGVDLSKIFNNCIKEKLGNEKVEIKNIPLKFRNTKDHGQTDAGHMTIVSYNWPNDARSNIIVIGGQYDKIRTMCICITDTEKFSDTWHRSSHKDLIVPRDRGNMFDSELFGEDGDPSYNKSYMLSLDIDAREETLGISLDKEYDVGILVNGFFLVGETSEFQKFYSDALDLFKMTLSIRRAKNKREQYLQSKFIEMK